MGSWDPSTLTMDWVKEQSSWFGYSTNLVYKNYGAGQANIFVGGSADKTHLSNGDNKEWVLSITRLTEAGVAANAFLISTEGTTPVTKENEHPYIDHMHLDDTTYPGEEWLFGSTRNNKFNKEGEEIHFWKMKLDSVSHDPLWFSF